jgi:hypothetical protein
MLRALAMSHAQIDLFDQIRPICLSGGQLARRFLCRAAV